MPETPIALRVPQQCANCGKAGTVKLQQTIKGERIVLDWYCTACEAEWPVKRKEEVASSQ